MPFTLLPTSPDQQADAGRNLAIRFGKTNEHYLDITESLTWLIMQAAVEEPHAMPWDWIDKAFSVVKAADLEGLDLNEISRLSFNRAAQAEHFVTLGLLWQRDARELEYKFEGIEV